MTVIVPAYVALVAVTLLHQYSEGRRRERAEAARKIGGLVSDLYRLTQGAAGASVWAILRELRSNTQFRAQMDLSHNSQIADLLDQQCHRLFSDVGSLMNTVHNVKGSYPKDELASALETFWHQIIEYRRLVSEFLRFLENTRGAEDSVQFDVPFDARVNTDLANEYDRFMDRVRNAKDDLELFGGSGWVADEHLVRFPRNH